MSETRSQEERNAGRPTTGDGKLTTKATSSPTVKPLGDDWGTSEPADADKPISKPQGDGRGPGEPTVKPLGDMWGTSEPADGGK
ncbi:hypothetical protein [Streptomyces marincola]|uniref:Uncharacterized protein n=1 Tax=Streptomyces marincola TaxID=2878388 RepID=A0A1W7CZH6_9ACTN|nr:hypothetical protein [Streptomyces marincola]ARQ70166.1 hypothetical protein CAG99_16100 [Streptomyces marincola]